MKKILRTGLVVILAFTAFLTLAACGNKDAAKKAFIKEYAALAQSKDNSAEFSVDLSKLKMTGLDKANADLMKLYEGSKITLKTSIDEKNKVVGLSGTIEADGKDYKLDMLMSKEGIYIDSDDLKALYSENKSALLSSSSSQSAAMVIDAMAEGLTAPYFLIDAALMDQGMSESGESWEKTIDEMFAASKPSSLTEKKLTEIMKKVPASDFTQNGNKVSYKSNLGDIYFLDFVKELALSTDMMTESQIKEAITDPVSESRKYLKKVDANVTLDKKQHGLTMDLGGKITAKGDTLDFKLDISSKSSKSSKSIDVPKEDEAQTMADLQESAINALRVQSQQGA